MLMSQSFNGVPTASILRLMLCSMGERITQLSEVEKSQTECWRITKSLKLLRLFLFCFPATTEMVLCLFSDFEKSRMLVSTVALSNIFKPAKSRSSIGLVFCAKNALVFSP